MSLESSDLDSITRALAEGFISECHPSERCYFPLVWSEFIAQRGDWNKISDGQSQLRRLGLAMDSQEPTLVSPWVILIVSAVLQELNWSHGMLPSEAEVCSAIKDSATALGATERLAVGLGNRLAASMLVAFDQAIMARPANPAVTSDQFLVWSSSKPQPSNPKPLSQAQLEKQYLKCEDRFDVVVRQDFSVRVRTRGGSKPLTMEKRHRRLLIMFLRYRGRQLPSLNLYLNAWQLNTFPTSYGGDKTVSDFLRVAVSELRRKMSIVTGFEIPKKLHQGCYSCEGDFSFCLILNAKAEQEFALPEAI